MSADNDDLFLDPRAKHMARAIPRHIAAALMVRPSQTLDLLRAHISEVLALELNFCRWVLHELAVPLQRQQELLDALGSRLCVRLMRFIDLHARDAPFDEAEQKVRRDLDSAKSPSDVLRVLADAMEKDKGKGLA